MKEQIKTLTDETGMICVDLVAEYALMNEGLDHLKTAETELANVN
jgi:hypothetical protein